MNSSEDDDDLLMPTSAHGGVRLASVNDTSAVDEEETMCMWSSILDDPKIRGSEIGY